MPVHIYVKYEGNITRDENQSIKCMHVTAQNQDDHCTFHIDHCTFWDRYTLILYPERMGVENTANAQYMCQLPNCLNWGYLTCHFMVCSKMTQ